MSVLTLIVSCQRLSLEVAYPSAGVRCVWEDMASLSAGSAAALSHTCAAVNEIYMRLRRRTEGPRLETRAVAVLCLVPEFLSLVGSALSPAAQFRQLRCFQENRSEPYQYNRSSNHGLAQSDMLVQHEGSSNAAKSVENKTRPLAVCTLPITRLAGNATPTRKLPSQGCCC